MESNRVKRNRVKQLFRRGLVPDEILDSLGPSYSLKEIYQHISAIIQGDSKWWKDNLELETRLRRNFKRMLDELQEAKKEGWIIAYEGANSSNYKQREAGVKIALESIKHQIAIMGFSGVTLNDLEARQKMERVNKEIEELKELAKSASKQSSST
ncbi:MAG: hypothetical protein ACYC7D_05170 [Nitrososphaerales archaeon]